jgi:hypothetical protein
MKILFWGRGVSVVDDLYTFINGNIKYILYVTF